MTIVLASPLTYRLRGIAFQGNTYFDMLAVTHLKGSLWLGGVMDDVILPERFRYVVSMHEGEAYALSPLQSRIQFRLSDDVGEQDWADLIPAVMATENALALASDGEDVLLHCQFGLNRSALVAGILLVRQGMTGAAAVDLMRATRTPAVLCNSYFEAMVRAWPHVEDL